MDLFAISGLVNGLTATAVGAYVFTRGYSDRRYQTYGLFCLSLSVWSYSYYFWLTSRTPEEAIFWVKCLMAGAIFILAHESSSHIGITKEPSSLETLGLVRLSGLLCFPLL